MPTETYIVRSKLLPPELSSTSISRPRLEAMARLSDLPKVSLVSAPAGYGKTTMLAQWHAHLGNDDVAAAWVSLDEEDRDAHSFLSHVIVSLADAGIDLGKLEAAAGKGLAGIKPRPALNGILNALHEAERETVLFLDDYHRAFSREVCSLTETLIERMPACSHVVLAGRGHPGIRISRLRSTGRILELSQSDIRFTREEARDYLTSNLQDSALDRVLEEVDGWPVGLHLFRMAGDKELASIETDTGFSNSMMELQDYWGEQVLRGLPDDYTRILMDISILDRVSGDLVNALSVRRDGWEVLDDFERRDLFIVPLDRERGWFQFHQLLRGYLLKRLERLHPERIVELHRRAALWWMAAGEVRSAFRHAAALEKPDLIVEFLDLIGGLNVCMRGGTPALQIVGKLPENLARANARLWLGRIYCLAQTGRATQARAEYRELEELTHNFTHEVNSRADALLAVEGYTLDLLLCGYENIATPPEPIAERINDLESIEGFPHFIMGWLKEILGWHYYANNAFYEAIRTGNEAAELCKNGACWYLSIYSRTYVALARIELCDVDKAAAELTAIVRDSETLFGPHNNTMIMPKVTLAQLAYWSRDFDTAEQLLEGLHDDLVDGEIWFNCVAAAYSVATTLARQRPSTGRVARQIENFAQGCRDKNPQWLPEMVLTYRLREAANALRTKNIVALLKNRFFKDIIAGELSTDRCGWRLWQPAASAVIRALIVLGAVDQAKAMLDRFEDTVAKSQHVLVRLKLKLLWAAYYSAAGDDSAAEMLTEALAMVSLKNFPQLFIDEACLLGSLAETMLGDNESVLSEEQRALLSDMAAAGPRPQYNDNGASAALPLPVSSSGKKTPLSNRETTVLHLIWNGLSTKEISRTLDLAEGTVKIYRKRLYTKLNAHSRAEAIAEGRRLAILGDPVTTPPTLPSAAGSTS